MRNLRIHPKIWLPVLAAVGILWAGNVFAYPSQIKILSKAEIAALPDDALTQTYIDAVVETEAKNAFHKTSGFTPRGYQEYKDLVRFRVELRAELDKRKLYIPQP